MCDCGDCDCTSCCPSSGQCNCEKVSDSECCKSCKLTEDHCCTDAQDTDCCACCCFRCGGAGFCAYCFCEDNDEPRRGLSDRDKLLVNKWSSHFCRCDGPLGEEWCVSLLCLACTIAWAKTKVDNSSALTNFICYTPCPASMYSFVRNEYRIKGTSQDWLGFFICCAACTTRRALSESRFRGGPSGAYRHHEYVRFGSEAQRLPHEYRKSLCDQECGQWLGACLCPILYAGEIRETLQPSADHCCCFDFMQVPCSVVGQARHALQIRPSCGGNGKRDDVCLACCCYPCAMARARHELNAHNWGELHMDRTNAWMSAQPNTMQNAIANMIHETQVQEMEVVEQPVVMGRVAGGPTGPGYQQQSQWPPPPGYPNHGHGQNDRGLDHNDNPHAPGHHHQNHPHQSVPSKLLHAPAAPGRMDTPSGHQEAVVEQPDSPQKYKAHGAESF